MNSSMVIYMHDYVEHNLHIIIFFCLKNMRIQVKEVHKEHVK
jgi:hypothetical protein